MVRAHSHCRKSDHKIAPHLFEIDCIQFEQSVNIATYDRLEARHDRDYPFIGGHKSHGARPPLAALTCQASLHHSFAPPHAPPGWP